MKKIKNKWIDATNYSMNDDKTIIAWEILGDELRIYITRTHRDNPGVWVMYCYPWFNTTELSATTLEDAKRKALKMVDYVLSKCMDDINKFRATF